MYILSGVCAVTVFISKTFSRSAEYLARTPEEKILRVLHKRKSWIPEEEIEREFAKHGKSKIETNRIIRQLVAKNKLRMAGQTTSYGGYEMSYRLKNY